MRSSLAPRRPFASLLIPLFLLAGSGTLSAAADTTDTVQAILRLGDRGLSGRNSPIHLLDLIDAQGEKILRDDAHQLPFSTRQTCAPCHDYKLISAGWHFSGGGRSGSGRSGSGRSGGDPLIEPGRSGQPWIYADSTLGLQVPLGYRQWSGLFRPAEIGLSRWDFIKKFGGLTAGGWGEGEQVDPVGYSDAWFTSGEPEANCMACHDRSFKQDRAEFHSQMSKGNYAWAATAASGLAHVTGSIENLPPLYDPYLPRPVDDAQQKPPQVAYHENVFDARNKVLLDLTRHIANERCYACHSTLYAAPAEERFAPLEADIHLSAGMQCVDCHTNGLNHLISRGYEGEPAVDPAASCRGCHIGAGESSPGGNFGAPNPGHAGMPATHLERLSCTTCHSGPLPGDDLYRVKTSQTHALGSHAADPSAEALPAVRGPLFAPGHDGKITPQYAVWPAYWGVLEGPAITPVALEQLIEIRALLAGADTTLDSRRWPADSADVILALQAMDTLLVQPGEPVYVAGGLLTRLAAGGGIIAREHEAGQPYTWPLAHAVRPARQSLGSGGCRDCHAGAAPFLYGNVQAAAVGYPAQGATGIQARTIGIGGLFSFALNGAILLRPVFKLLLILGSLLLAVVLFKLLSRLLDRFLARLSAGRDEG